MANDTPQFDKAYSRQLSQLMPELYWFRHYHVVTENELQIYGSIVVKDVTTLDTLVACVNGVKVSIQYVEADPYTNDKFWFLPEANRRGVVIRGSAAMASVPVSYVRIWNAKSEKGEDFQSSAREFGCVVDEASFGEVPPPSAIERVSGKGSTAFSYLNNGITDFRRFYALAHRHGIDLTSPSVRVLDWGCGCGRLTRHLLSLPAGKQRIWGIDIDSDNVAWDIRHLSAGNFKAVELMPPTPFKSSSFDVVIANSVLSHLRLEVAEAWLDEIRRILVPGGVALLSYHGEFSLIATASKTPTFVEKVLGAGFNADIRASELDNFISDPEYYRQTFMTDIFAERLFRRYFNFKERVVGIVSRFQNVAVLRR